LVVAVSSFFFIEQYFLHKVWTKSSFLKIGSFYLILFLSTSYLLIHSYLQKLKEYASQDDDIQYCPFGTTTAAWCSVANNPKADEKAIVLGDSHAHSQYFGLHSLFPKIQWTLLAHHSCSPFIIDDLSSDSCQAEFKKAFNKFELEDSYKWLILVSANRTFEEHRAKITSERNFSKIAKLFKKVFKRGKKIVIFDPVPEISPNVFACSRKRPAIIQHFLKNIDFCKISYAEWKISSEENRKFYERLKLLFPQLILVNPEQAICNETECNILKNGLSLYLDKDHLSNFGSIQTAELLLSNMSPP
jgi:hypothetical protein